MARTLKLNHDEITKQILERLDITSEYRALGVDLVGSPAADGWMSCRAVGRDDRTPSAAVNIVTGRYKDHGGSGDNLSLWDFAARHGTGFATWTDAKRHYAAKAGVDLNGQPAAKDPAKNLDFREWNESIVSLWCRHKPGITPEAVRAVGGRLAKYRRQYTVIALPVFGPQLTAADPIGWVLLNTTGGTLPVFGGGGPPKQVKMLSTAGSKAGLMGEVDYLQAVRADGAVATTIWKTEGPTDMLALWAAKGQPTFVPTDVVLCNSQGAGENPRADAVDQFAGCRVHVIHDADQPGQAGAVKWAAALARVASTAKNVQLPFEIAQDHGQDLRDYFAASNTFADLQRLAADVEPLDPSKSSDDDGAKPLESDDDPHRLARLLLRKTFPPAADGAGRLRRWRHDWWLWRGRAYCKVDDQEIQAKACMAVKEEFDAINIEQLQDVKDDGTPPKARKVTRPAIHNVLAALESMTTVPGDLGQPAWVDEDDDQDSQTTNCVSMANGILDLDALLRGRESVMFGHTPMWFSPISLDYPFDPDADCPRWKAVIEQNLAGDQDRIALLQEWAGYLLMPDTGQQKFLVLEGEGANGKSVFCAAMEAMIGEDNASHISLEIFGQRFALFDTLGKLVNIAADCGELDKVAEGYLKSFTSGDRMFFDRKIKPGINVTPTARLMMGTNNRPRFSDKSGGLWRRMILVPMEVEITEADRIVGMDKPAWWAASGELPGIFGWAVAGLNRLRTQGEFTRPRACVDALADYRLEINPARSFLFDHFESDPMEDEKTSLVYAMYKTWCGTNGYRPMGERTFGKEVKRCFRGSTRKKLGDRSKREYFYVGIKNILTVTEQSEF